MKKIKLKIIEVATKVVNEEIDLLDGCRTLVLLQRELKEKSELFLVLRGIDSETDIFPISISERKQWNSEALSKLDKERNEYTSSVKEEIIEACKLIVTSLTSCLENV